MTDEESKEESSGVMMGNSPITAIVIAMTGNRDYGRSNKKQSIAPH
ncbi:hypothetical protein H6G52_14360 [Limnothrix sp. FACHB-881]|nr:hypothetical protein [Limnothrix sp. FACHB-881]MBD2636549.1 hypothetical protein [Limnothrix sp. FACHB-881]